MKTKENQGELSKKFGSFVLSPKTNWKTPPKERYVPFREVAAYSVGGIGVKFLIFVCCLKSKKIPPQIVKKICGGILL